jgi:hypothetical protein
VATVHAYLLERGMTPEYAAHHAEQARAYIGVSGDGQRLTFAYPGGLPITSPKPYEELAGFIARNAGDAAFSAEAAAAMPAPGAGATVPRSDAQAVREREAMIRATNGFTLGYGGGHGL